MAQVQWDPGPVRPRLAAGTVDVWCADLAAGEGYEPTLLSSEERERAARFVRPGHAERWTTAHGILRALLGAYLDADPRTLQFAQGSHGKPRLVGDEGLRFNLSHSDDIGLIAVALDREVGVDIELPRRRVDHVAIAGRVLGEAEATRLAALDLPHRARDFLRAWSRWEAALKCRGTGIGAADSATGEPAPWVHELHVDPPGAAALAVADGPVDVRCWRWPPAEPGWLPTISRP